MFESLGSLFKETWIPKPEISLPSQRQLKHLPLVEVTAVDPSNPHEIDDAFTVTKRPNSPMEVSIVFPRGGQIPYTSQTFQQAFENGWSEYPSPKVYLPMIEDVGLVTFDLSLIEGELRSGIELSFQLTQKGVTKNRKIRPVAVKTTQKTYQGFGEEIKNGHHSDVVDAINLLRKYRGKWGLEPLTYLENVRDYGDSNYSPEERLARNVVQELMIHANKEIGREANSFGFSYPYRYTDQIIELGDIGVEPGTQNVIDTTSLYRAYYAPNPKRHEFLDTTKYTHSTSPLRRFMDLLGHNIFEFIFQGGKPSDVNGRVVYRACQHINHMIDEKSINSNNFDM